MRSENPGKSLTTVLQTDFHEKLIDTYLCQMQLNLKFHKNLCIDFSVALATKFLDQTHRRTDSKDKEKVIETFSKNSQIM